MDSPTRRAKAKKYFTKAKERALREDLSASEKYPLCLEYMEMAYDLCPKDNYKKKIDELKEIIAQADQSVQDVSSDEDFSSKETTQQSAVKSEDEDSMIVKRKVKPKIDDDDDLDEVVNKVADLTVLSNDSSSPSSSMQACSSSRSKRQVSQKKDKEPKFTDVVGFEVVTTMFNKLYDYQVEGIKWLFNLFKESRQNGCILADDMGLGKTVQSITFLSTLLENKEIKSALVIGPNTLLANWKREFEKWYPNIEVYFYASDMTPRKRLENLRYVQRNGGVLFTTYGLLQNHTKYLGIRNGTEFVWDVVVLDEAHKIKNPTKTTRAACDLPSYFRLAITGTPVQNNLRELWSIYEWAKKGTLFGSYTSFKLDFEDPITKARHKNSKPKDVLEGNRLAQELREMYEPFFLRRTKEEVLHTRRSQSGDSLSAMLPTKYDWIVWIKLSENQISMYKEILNSPEVRAILNNRKKHALVQLSFLKKLCDSLFLIPFSVIKKLVQRTRRRKKKQDLDESVLDVLIEDGKAQELVNINSVDDDDLLEDTSKLAFLVELLDDLKKNGHRTLVFSQSTRMLDIIQKVLTNRRFELARLDGRVKMKERDAFVTAFQESNSIDVYLLTTQVGGVGLTLTNADRVVIYDPSWNPGSDAQAIDRVYRIGQKRHVIVYRLITCGSVEERIFRRQVFKNSVIKQMVQKEEDPTRYFSDTDMKELFKFENFEIAETCQQFEDMHGNQRQACSQTDDHRDLVLKSSCVLGVSDHNLLFSVESEKDTVEDDEVQYIEEKVKKSRMKIQEEASNIRRNLEEQNLYSKPFELPVHDSFKRDTPSPLCDNLPNHTNIEEIVIDDEFKYDTAFFDQPTVLIDDSLGSEDLKDSQKSAAKIEEDIQSFHSDNSEEVMDDENIDGSKDEDAALNDDESDYDLAVSPFEVPVKGNQHSLPCQGEDEQTEIIANDASESSSQDKDHKEEAHVELGNEDLQDISFNPSNLFHSTAVNPELLMSPPCDTTGDTTSKNNQSTFPSDVLSRSKNEEPKSLQSKINVTAQEIDESINGDYEEAERRSPAFDAPLASEEESTFQANTDDPSSVSETPPAKLRNANHTLSGRDGNRSSYFDQPSGYDVTRMLNDIEVPPFDRTNHALKELNRTTRSFHELSEEEQELCSKSPPFDDPVWDASQGDGILSQDSFHLNSSMFKTPTPVKCTSNARVLGGDHFDTPSPSVMTNVTSRKQRQANRYHDVLPQQLFQDDEENRPFSPILSEMDI